MRAPTLERFTLDALPPQPWKNGGGTTREIAAMPPGSGPAGFVWRVSVAEIERAGPFSAFPGVDRQIVLLAGAGVRLRGGAVDHRLDRPLEPFAFVGEAPIEAELLGGASRDLNVMTRRGAARADLQILHEAGLVGACDALVLLAVRGPWQVASLALAPGEGVVAREGVPALPVEAGAAAGALVAIRLLLGAR
ncbi:MAG TPA: HutD family protein [Polyangiaceae bacterium]|nr:HutD family protein [Polyangiaceae bacterium]